MIITVNCGITGFNLRTSL